MMLSKKKFPTIPSSFLLVLLLFLLQLLGTESHSFSRDCPKKVPGYPCQVDKCPNGGYWSECGLDKDGDPDTKTAYDLGCTQLVYEKVKPCASGGKHSRYRCCKEAPYYRDEN